MPEAGMPSALRLRLTVLADVPQRSASTASFPGPGGPAFPRSTAVQPCPCVRPSRSPKYKPDRHLAHMQPTLKLSK
jgi:hypothetical protein